MKDMKHFRRKARRWLTNNGIIYGDNGFWNTETINHLIENLAKTMFKIYNSPPSD